MASSCACAPGVAAPSSRHAAARAASASASSPPRVVVACSPSSLGQGSVVPTQPLGPEKRGPDEKGPPPGAPRSVSSTKPQVLRRAAEFQLVLTKGWRWTTQHLVVHVMPNQLESSRLGLTISRKVGDAVRRNRMRRRLRESFRRHLRVAIGEPRVDLVVRPLPGSAPVTQAQLQDEILEALDAWRSGRSQGRRRPAPRRDE